VSKTELPKISRQVMPGGSGRRGGEVEEAVPGERRRRRRRRRTRTRVGGGEQLEDCMAKRRRNYNRRSCGDAERWCIWRVCAVAK